MNATEHHKLALRIVAATHLREAVSEFNEAPISISAVDAFRERVLRIADYLAPVPADREAMAEALILADCRAEPIPDRLLHSVRVEP